MIRLDLLHRLYSQSFPINLLSSCSTKSNTPHLQALLCGQVDVDPDGFDIGDYGVKRGVN